MLRVVTNICLAAALGVGLFVATVIVWVEVQAMLGNNPFQ